MARDITLGRDHGELIVELLMLSDSGHAWDLDSELRRLFGMATREQHLAAMGRTLEEVRQDWARKILAGSCPA
jgi:hypothetical protein